MAENPWYSAELTALRASVTEFVRREVLPHQDEWERAGELPREYPGAADEAKANP